MRRLSILSLITMVACSENSTAPEPDPGGGGGGGPAANPAGVLLDGAGPAIDAMGNLPPSQVDPEHVRDGIYASRLVAVLDPDATVADVNTALETHDARVVAMAEGAPVLTLVIDPVDDRAAAESLAAALAATPAFGYVGVAVDLDRFALRAAREVPSALDPGRPQAAARLNAAWTARDLVTSATDVTLIVPDYYVDDALHPDIPGQEFVEAVGGWTPGSVGGFAEALGASEYGNLGTYTAGVAGGRPDADTFIGMHPAPEHLTVRCVPVAGLPAPDRLFAIADAIPDDGRVVVAYGDPWAPDFEEYGHYDRALCALLWRRTHDDEHRMLTCVTAGDGGEVEGDAGRARYASPMALAAVDEDILAFAAQDPNATDASLDLLAAWLANGASERLRNTLAVGHSAADGSEAPASGRGSDVRMIGEGVLGPCRVADGADCDGMTGIYVGSRAATAQVAGLAAYLWALDPDRSGPELRTLLHQAHVFADTPGVLDAYLAVQMLDPTVASELQMVVRESILDVAGGDDAPGSDGWFDEHDLYVYVHAFDEGENATTPDYSRYDLNGDGFTGGAIRRARFDLDGDPETFGIQTIMLADTTLELDERAVTDLEILCYYAHTDMYVGDDEARSILLGGCVGAPADLQVTTQAQLDALAGLREIHSLVVGPEAPATSNITSLDALSELRQVEVLYIRNNPGLTTLGPLGNLFAVRQNLVIDGNDLLENLDGLQSLSDIEGKISIVRCASLTSLAGLESLVTANGLSVGQCPALTTLSPLSGAASVSNLTLTDCDGLVNLEGLGGFAGLVTGAINLARNDNLVSLDGLGAVTDVLGTVGLYSCPSLTGLGGLGLLRSAGYLSIRDCASLTSLAELQSLQSVDNLYLTQLPGVESVDLPTLSTVGTLVIESTGIRTLDGLTGLTTLTRQLDVNYNPELTSLSGLGGIADADLSNRIVIGDNPMLASLAGLEGIRSAITVNISGGYQGAQPMDDLDGLGLEHVSTLRIALFPHVTSISALSGIHVTGTLGILSMPQLENVDGLEAITHLNGSCVIRNAGVEDLDGLENLLTVAGDLRLEGLTRMSACEVAAFASDISVGGTQSVPECGEGSRAWAERR